MTPLGLARLNDELCIACGKRAIAPPSVSRCEVCTERCRRNNRKRLDARYASRGRPSRRYVCLACGKPAHNARTCAAGARTGAADG